MKTILMLLSKMLRLKKKKICSIFLPPYFSSSLASAPLVTSQLLNLYAHPDYPVIINDKKHFERDIKPRASGFIILFLHVRNQTSVGFSPFCLHCGFRVFQALRAESEVGY